MFCCLVYWAFVGFLGEVFLLDKYHNTSQETDNNFKMAFCYGDMKWNNYQLKKIPWTSQYPFLRAVFRGSEEYPVTCKRSLSVSFQ